MSESFRKLINLVEGNNRQKIFLHGGSEKIIDSGFKRHANRGHDSGALFFIEESPTGYKYALGYAIKYPNGGVYRVKINLPDSEIFDYTNKQHREQLLSSLSAQEIDYLEKSKGSSGHLDWATVDDELFEDLGFKAVMFHERSKGFNNFEEDAISIGVFDPRYIEIIDFIKKEELLQKYGR